MIDKARRLRRLRPLPPRELQLHGQPQRHVLIGIADQVAQLHEGRAVSNGHLFKAGVQPRAAKLHAAPDGDGKDIASLKAQLNTWHKGNTSQKLGWSIGFGYDDAQLAEQRVSPLGALRAVTLDAANSPRLENQVGSIVPGKLANFTILAANLLKMDPVRSKDIAVWGTVQEERVLPVNRVPGMRAVSVLGPVLDPPTLASVNRAEAAVAGHEHGESCTLAQWLAKAASQGFVHQTLTPSSTTKQNSPMPAP